jgi:hypothetical protein
MAIASFVLNGMLNGATIPLMYDVVAEQSFGVAPVGVAIMVLNIGTSAIQVAGFFTPADSFFSWINWSVSGVSVCAAIMLWLWLPAELPKFEFDSQRDSTIDVTAHPIATPAEPLLSDAFAMAR